MAKKKELTLKQKKFLVEYFKTGNATRSAMKAYKCKSYDVAGSIGYENLKKLHAPIKTLMEKHGLSAGSLIAVLGEGLEAKKIHGTGDNFVEIEDYAVRHKYLETAARWLKLEGGGAGTAVQVNIFNRLGKKDNGFVEDAQEV